MSTDIIKIGDNNVLSFTKPCLLMIRQFAIPYPLFLVRSETMGLQNPSFFDKILKQLLSYEDTSVKRPFDTLIL